MRSYHHLAKQEYSQEECSLPLHNGRNPQSVLTLLFSSREHPQPHRVYSKGAREGFLLREFHDPGKLGHSCFIFKDLCDKVQ